MATVSKIGSFLIAYLGAKYRLTHLRGEALADYQDRRARATVQYAISHSPFYRERFAGHNPADWARLPCIDKTDMVRRFEDLNTRGIPLELAHAAAKKAEEDGDCSPTVDGVTVGLSSGTSGQRGLFLLSPQEQAAWAGFILARAIPGLPRPGTRIALFLRANSNLYQRLHGSLIHFRHFSLACPIGRAVDELNQYRPHYLAAPPSMLETLAAQRDRGHLHIRPRRIYSVAEVLEPQDQTALNSAFDCPVSQIYQATEGLIAVACMHGSLHLQEDLVAVQFEPPEVQGCLSGDPRLANRCMPIITDLRRRTQPIIRYRLKDLLALNPADCPCGSAFRIIRRIEGRASDICHACRKDGSLVAVFPDELRSTILASHNAIRDYRVIQDSPGRFHIHLASTSSDAFPSTAASVQRALTAWAQAHQCNPPECIVTRGIPAGPTGLKRQRVRRI